MRGRDTAGHCAGGTHPTGMHSCLFNGLIRSRNVINSSNFLLQRNCRYDSQIAVFGDQFQEKLGKLNYFVVSTVCSFLKL